MFGARYETDDRNQTIVTLLFIVISAAPSVGSFCSLKYLCRRGLITSLCNGPAGPNTVKNCDDVATHVIQ